MACPYFRPTVARRAPGDTRAAMLPLGDFWTGDCHSIAAAPAVPGPAAHELLCNLGYARGHCERFPAGDGPDAVRFTICADDNASIHLYYVLERDHHPFGHGPIEYTRGDAALTTPPDLEAHARAYIASYLRRKAESA